MRPYIILNRISWVNFQIAITGRQVPASIYVNPLKHYYDQSKHRQADPPALSDSVPKTQVVENDDEDDTAIFLLQKFKSRLQQGVSENLVKWAVYPKSSDLTTAP